MAQLAQLSNVAAVTIKAYVRRGLLGRVKFYGAATRYPREHLVRLLVIRCCRAQGMRNLDEIRRKLDIWGPADMERWVLAHPIALDTLAALGYPQTEAPNATEVKSAPANVEPKPAAPVEAAPVEAAPVEAAPAAANTSVLPTENWRRVVLMPGLELQVKAGAGSIVESVADRLVQNFAQLVTAQG